MIFTIDEFEVGDAIYETVDVHYRMHVGKHGEDNEIVAVVLLDEFSNDVYEDITPEQDVELSELIHKNFNSKDNYADSVVLQKRHH